MSRKYIVIALVVVLCIGVSAFIYQAVAFQKNPQDTQEYSFAIRRGENAFQIAKHLEQAGLIRSRLGFDVYVLVKGMRRDLKAGTYILSPSMSVAEITNAIAAGGDSAVTIRIPEGWNVKQIASYLQEQGIATSEDFLAAAGFGSQPQNDLVSQLENQFSFLKDKPAGQNLEGYLFPDTYQISRATNAKEILEMMLQNFERKFSQALRAL